MKQGTLAALEANLSPDSSAEALDQAPDFQDQLEVELLALLQQHLEQEQVEGSSYDIVLLGS